MRPFARALLVVSATVSDPVCAGGPGVLRAALICRG
jgi:hypothetical protein